LPRLRKARKGFPGGGEAAAALADSTGRGPGAELKPVSNKQ